MSKKGKDLFEKIIRKIDYLKECDPKDIHSNIEKLEDIDEAIGNFDVDKDGELI